MKKPYKQLVGRVCGTLMAVLVTCGAAEATPIQDVTVAGLAFTYDGVLFTATNEVWVDPFTGTAYPIEATISWTSPPGSSPILGFMNLEWDGVLGTGSFDVRNDANALLLQGLVTSFSASVGPGVGANFLALATLSAPSWFSGLGGTGSDVALTFGSTNFTSGAGTGQVDILAVPEPSTLTLLGLGAAVAIFRRRRASLS